jgi:hypothetical protein
MGKKNTAVADDDDENESLSENERVNLRKTSKTAPKAKVSKATTEASKLPKPYRDKLEFQKQLLELKKKV